MEPVFPKWSNSVVRTGLGVALAGLVGIPVLLMAYVRTPYATGQFDPIDQPVEFDHRHHVADSGIDCLYCHYNATESSFAGVPPAAVCMNCHGQIWTESPLLEPVRNSFFTERPLPWERVHQLPDFVFFDHSIHLAKGVGCASCHGRVDKMARVYQAEPLTMAWCLDCHQNPDPHLRPLDKITEMDWQPELPQAEFGAALREKLDVDPPLNCTACHR